MLQLRGADNLYIDKDLTGFADKMDKDGVFPRRVDLLLLGFAHAVAERLPPADRVKRHELIRATSLDETIQLSICAAAQVYARDMDLEPPQDERSLLSLICNAGIAGMRALKERWEGRTKSQIQLDVMKLTEGATLTS